MSSSATRLAGERQVRWPRETVIEKIKRWVELYDEPPKSADWNPSAAKWAGQTWRIERYRLGDPATGEPWPSLNAAKRAFDNSLDEAVRAAGYEPAKPGPKRASARPVLPDLPPDVSAALGAVRAEVRRLEEKVATRDRMLERERARRERAEAMRPRSTTRTVTRVVEKPVGDEKAETRLKAKLDDATLAVARAQADAADARDEAKTAQREAAKLASRIERAEAKAQTTIAELRDERRTLKREAALAEDRAAAAETALERERARGPEVQVVTREVEVQSVSDREVAAAMAARDRAEHEAHEADLRAARAERELAETVALVTGEKRRLTQAEVETLKRKGPAGPAVLSAALQAVTRARKDGTKAELDGALLRLAEAAVMWRERL
jgi:hypothetical protein